MHLIKIFRQSISNPDFYRGLPGQPFSFSVKYYYSLVLALSVMLTAVFSFYTIPALHDFLRDTGGSLIAHFPDELVVTIKNGRAATNVKEPYSLAIPDELRKSSGESGRLMPDNLLVIDTTEPFTEEAFRAHNTLLLLTRDSIAYSGQDKGGAITIRPLSAFPDLVVDKKLVVSLSDGISILVRWLAPIVVLGIFFILMLGFTLKLLYVFILSALILLVGKLKRVPLTYKNAYQIGLHAMSLALVVDAILLASYRGLRVPLLFTIITLFIVWFNLFPREDAPVSAPPDA